MTTLTVYTCTIPSCTYILPNGKACIFVNGFYRTSIESEILQLNLEIAQGHPHIGVPAIETERTIDSELVDPMNALRAKIIAEYKASQEIAAGDPNRDMGTTDQSLKLNVGSTKDISEAAMGGSGSGLAARLVNLQKGA